MDSTLYQTKENSREREHEAVVVGRKQSLTAVGLPRQVHRASGYSTANSGPVLFRFLRSTLAQTNSAVKVRTHRLMDPRVVEGSDRSWEHLL